MIHDMKAWLTHCITLDGKKWRTMMQQAAFYRKHLIMDRSWEPIIEIDHKTAWHALSWARMSLEDVDKYNSLLSQVREARDKYHAEKKAKDKVHRRTYKREYMRQYRADKSSKRLIEMIKAQNDETSQNYADEP